MASRSLGGCIRLLFRGGGVRRRSSFRNEEAHLETRFVKLQMLDPSLFFASCDVSDIITATA